jgi:hypothetical protein
MITFGLGCLMATACGGDRQEPRAQSGGPVLGDGTAEPASPSELKVLAALDELAPGQPRAIGDLSVVADAPYHAASGRTCRGVTLTSTLPPKHSRTRLACKHGQQWQFAPSVFLAPSD